MKRKNEEEKKTFVLLWAFAARDLLYMISASFFACETTSDAFCFALSLIKSILNNSKSEVREKVKKEERESE